MRDHCEYLLSLLVKQVSGLKNYFEIFVHSKLAMDDNGCDTKNLGMGRNTSTDQMRHKYIRSKS
jgi:hypothetical protein